MRGRQVFPLLRYQGLASGRVSEFFPWPRICIAETTRLIRPEMLEAFIEAVLLSSLVTLIIGAGLLFHRLRSGQRHPRPEE